MKREIEVWVHSDCLRDFDNSKRDYFDVSRSKSPMVNLKAKLVIEVPERKVTITEGELEEIFKAHDPKNGKCVALSLDLLKSKMFAR